MRLFLPIVYPDACSVCEVPFGEEEQRIGVLMSRGVPENTASELGALYEARAYHIACAPPPGTPGRVVGGLSAETGQHRSNALSSDHFIAVAAVYREALMRKLAPTLHVSLVFGISRSTAAKWVMEARRQEFLPKTQKGISAA
jgi:hypothetical protein